MTDNTKPATDDQVARWAMSAWTDREQIDALIARIEQEKARADDYTGRFERVTLRLINADVRIAELEAAIEASDKGCPDCEALWPHHQPDCGTYFTEHGTEQRHHPWWEDCHNCGGSGVVAKKAGVN